MRKSVGVAGLLVMVGMSACGGGGENAYDTLPLITAATQPPELTTTTTLPEAVEYYTIQQGDTLYGIAQSFGITLDDLIAFNGITDPDAIEAGQRLKVPPVGASIPPASTTTVAQTTTP